MNKYNFDFRKKVVQEYLNGTMGTKSLAKKYGIPSNKTIRVWVASFKTYGEQALKPMVKPKMYSSQYKLHVVKLYLRNKEHTSFQKLAVEEQISDKSRAPVVMVVASVLIYTAFRLEVPIL